MIEETSYCAILCITDKKCLDACGASHLGEISF